MIKSTLRHFVFANTAALLISVMGMSIALAGDLPPDVQTKVDSYKAKLTEWAANPTIIAAVKDSNAKGGLAPDMGNAKWDELTESDPLAQSIQTSDAGKLLKDWAKDGGISKLYLRDKDGNIVAGDSKPIVYNNAKKPPFVNAMKGTAWAAGEVKPDPTTQVKGVGLSVPVLDGGAAIGVLHTSVVVQ